MSPRRGMIQGMILAGFCTVAAIWSVANKVWLPAAILTVLAGMNLWFASIWRKEWRIWKNGGWR